MCMEYLGCFKFCECLCVWRRFKQLSRWGRGFRGVFNVIVILFVIDFVKEVFYGMVFEQGYRQGVEKFVISFCCGGIWVFVINVVFSWVRIVGVWGSRRVFREIIRRAGVQYIQGSSGLVEAFIIRGFLFFVRRKCFLGDVFLVFQQMCVVFLDSLVFFSSYFFFRVINWQALFIIVFL